MICVNGHNLSDGETVCSRCGMPEWKNAELDEGEDDIPNAFDTELDYKYDAIDREFHRCREQEHNEFFEG